ncbi:MULTISPECIES: toprim domain-containing protein [Bacteroides]|jgi:DNA primase|uniref:toprim domain-containing protein n=1 Tax=Bacteroides TaxID=816 RepID=UPI000E737E84|nr:MULTISPECIES: toprim domain-containing protein [Bacteroides]RJU62524.1 hypothetical protein DW862_13210 [Bacteroides sp. AM37-9]
MELSKKEKEYIIQELSIELHAKPDGSGKNLIVPQCPYCGHEGGKYGIYIGKATERKKPFMAHCFSCGRSTQTLEQLLTDIGRQDLIITDTFDLDGDKKINDFSFLENDDREIDDSLCVVEMPEYYKRTHFNRYLRKRGFIEEDYDFFPVGTTRNMNFKFDDYVIFPIIDNGDIVGYISRHIWDKADIDEYNRKASHNGKFQIMRYRNSTENDFVKLLYNYDSIIEDETDTVILVEGVFDVIALTRKLNLYNNPSVAVVATFGKKISDTQIYKLQAKGVHTIVIGYDGDATEAIKKTGDQLNEYFDCYVADIEDSSQDFDSMDFWEIYDTFAFGLKTLTEYKLNKIQI